MRTKKLSLKTRFYFTFKKGLKGRGFTPIFILLIVAAIVAVAGGAIIIRNNKIQTDKTANSTVTAPPSAITATETPSSNIAPQTTAKPTATKTAIPKPATNTNPPAATSTSVQYSKATCNINILSSPTQYSLQLSVGSTNNGTTATGTGVRWDFDGNGSWDTDFSANLFPVTHDFQSAGTYNVKAQIKMSDGLYTNSCSKSTSVPYGTTITLSGTAFSDSNCSGTREASETTNVSGATINIFLRPSGELYSTLTTDGNGSYNYSTSVQGVGGYITIQPSAVAPSGYKIFYDPSAHTFDSTNTHATQDIPLVPNEDVGLCPTP